MAGPSGGPPRLGAAWDDRIAPTEQPSPSSTTEEGVELYVLAETTNDEVP